MTALQIVAVLSFSFSMLIATTVAFLKGSAPEKLGVGIIYTGLLLQVGALRIFPAKFTNVDPVALFVDTFLLISFGYLAINARRVWPLWVTAFQLLCLAAHFARWLQLELDPLAYAITKTTPTIIASVFIAVGAILNSRDRAKGYFRQDWVNWKANAKG